jgi:predicted alpha/beta-fold hydrolase
LPFYDRHYARGLRAQVARHERLVPGVVPARLPSRLTLRRFDDLYTAPRGGFADALDYYTKASALPWTPRIQTPALIITARDDPFVAVEAFEELPPRPGQEVHILPRGGHLGYIGLDGAGGLRWVERRVAAWLLEQVGL